MDDIAKFFGSLMGSHNGSQPAMQPNLILASIDAGILILPAAQMQNAPGVASLTALVAHVGRNRELILGLDKARHTDHASAYEKLLERLIQSGANPWQAGADGACAFDYALWHNWEHAAQRFLKHPQSPKGDHLARGRMGANPWVCLSAQRDMRSVLKILLAKNAAPSLPDEHGRTPLHLARSAATVDLLLQAGANLDALDDNGLTIEEQWSMSVNKEAFTPAERHKMSSCLMVYKMGRGNRDAKFMAADMVANAGPMLGIRDGSSMLKKAGWNDGKVARTSVGLSIFACRMEHRIGNLFRNEENESLLTSSDYFSRMSKDMAWMDKNSPEDRDMGLARMAMWMLRLVRGSTSTQRFNEVIEQEEKLGLPTNIDFNHQQYALDALRDGVARGTINNASAAAGIAFGGILGHGEPLGGIFQANNGRDPLFIQWMEAIYLGSQDPAWNAIEKGSYTRPDVPIKDVLAQTLPHLPAEGHEFWTHPKLPALFLRVYGGVIGINNRSCYFDPCNEDGYKATSGAPTLPASALFTKWVTRLDCKNLMAEAEANPISGFLYGRLAQSHPEIASLVQRHCLDQQASVALARNNRRGL